MDAPIPSVPPLLALGIKYQIAELLILGIPIACIARTVVFEEVFREPRDWCRSRSEICRKWYERKFFYLFTCEYCFSHYVTAFFLFLTHFKLLFDDWRGYVISFFALVFVANAYLNVYGRLRVEITKEKAVTKALENDQDGRAKTEALRASNSL